MRLSPRGFTREDESLIFEQSNIYINGADDPIAGWLCLAGQN